MYLTAALVASGRVSEAHGPVRDLRAALSASTDRVARARALTSLIDVAHGSDPATAAADLVSYTALAEDVGAPSLLATASHYSGLHALAHDPPDAPAALAYFRRASDLAREASDLNIEGRSLFGSMVATTLLDRPEDDPAGRRNVTDLHRAAVIRFRDTRSPVMLVPALDTIAWWFAVNRENEPAGVLYGYLEANHGPFAYIPIQRMRQAGLNTIRQLPGREAWMARGAAMNADELFAFTLAHLPEQPTAREQQ